MQVPEHVGSAGLGKDLGYDLKCDGKPLIVRTGSAGCYMEYKGGNEIISHEVRIRTFIFC